MKIRLGFVSNSSSASYVVTINKSFLSLEAFLVDIYDTCWCAIQEQEAEYFYQQENHERLHPTDPYETNIEKSIFGNMPERVPRVRRHTEDDGGHGRYIDFFDEKVEATRYTLQQEGIDVREISQGKYSLTYFTSMHNSFNDMNELLKCIYLEYYINQGGAIFEFESDN